MDDPEVVAFAPGRANLIGEHTDYNGGRSLPFAVEQGIRVAARRGPGEVVRVRSDQGQQAELDLRRLPDERIGDWRDFARGALGELGNAGIDLPGAELEVQSSLPSGAGLSSSAALSVSLCRALLGLAGSGEPDPLWLARLCSRIENDWVGADTGLLDQMASVLGRRDHAIRIDFATLDHAAVPLALEGWRLFGVDSGEKHQLSDAEAGYGERRRECERARERLGLETLSRAAPDALEELPEPLVRRARHVIEENRRVEETIQALERRDLRAVGRLLDASHASLRDQFEVSTPAVEETVERLRREGAAGARIMGGGFGGTVLALLPPGAEDPAGGIPLRAGDGARLLSA